MTRPSDLHECASCTRSPDNSGEKCAPVAQPAPGSLVFAEGHLWALAEEGEPGTCVICGTRDVLAGALPPCKYGFYTVRRASDPPKEQGQYLVLVQYYNKWSGKTGNARWEVHRWEQFEVGCGEPYWKVFTGRDYERRALAWAELPRIPQEVQDEL